MILDADRIVHEALAEGGEAVESVLRLFPSAAADGGGAVDRERLAGIVFADPDSRRLVQSILHPIAWRRSEELTERARSSGADMVVTEATLLFEAARDGGPDPHDRFDAIVMVVADPEALVARAVARKGPHATDEQRRRVEADVRARLAAQMPQEAKARLADFVVRNTGDLAELERQVEVLHSKLLHHPSRR